MPLLVVPLAPDDAGLLTLAEYDRLVGCEVVVFEDASHPLLERLGAAGLTVATVGDSGRPEARRDAWGLIADPLSPAIVKLAKEGAEVAAGSGLLRTR